MTAERTDTGEVRVLSTEAFFAELVAVTRQRTASMFLYLMLEEAAGIAVQWEQPGLDHLRRYRVVDTEGPACPHCTLIDAAAELAPVLPLDIVRAARAKAQYETVLRTGLLPYLAFARRPGGGAPGWLGDCHGAPGSPHTDADCAEHRMPTPIADPLAEIGVLPRALRELYPSDGAAERDIATRRRIAREWRDAAEEVAGGRAETEATRAFLKTAGVLGVPLPGLDGQVLTLTRAEAADNRSLGDLVTVASRTLASEESRAYHKERLCLAPEPEPTRHRMPSYSGGLDLSTGQPVRVIRVPTGVRPLSRRGRGVLLLHQARYAMGKHYVPGPTKPLGHWEAEAALHIFEFGLLHAIGGAAYDTAVGAFVTALRGEGDLLERPERVLDRRQLAALAEVFDGADDEEVHLWGSVAYRNAILALLGSQAAFAEYLRTRDL